MYDVAIIGGGPAGTTLARKIGKSMKVLLLDRKKFTEGIEKSGYIKCCGGLLAPDAQKMLARQGLALPQNVIVGPQIFVVRTIDLAAKLEQYYQRFYINIDREKFDYWMASLVPETVDFRSNCLYKYFETEEDGYNLHFSQNGREYVEKARIIIGADGGFSQVRKQAFAYRPIPKQYISIQDWYQTEAVAPYFSAIFDPEVTDFYAWTIPKDDAVLLGVALTPGMGALAKFELLKQKLQEYGYHFGERVKREGAFILRPLKTAQLCPGEGKIGLIGEAAGWISPSSAEGLSYALRSAEVLADSLLTFGVDFSNDYARRTNSLTRNIFLKNAKSPFMYHPFLRKLALRSGVGSIEVCTE